MKKTKLKKLTVEELKKKEQESKVLIGIFIPIILGLFYFTLRDYVNGGDIDKSTLIFAICSIGGMVSVFPGLKSVREELKEREE